MLGLLSYALKQVIIELCQEKSSNHEKHGWNFYSQAVFLQPLSNRQRPTFPGSFPPSIISAKELNYCVRDGNRWILLAIVTGFLTRLFRVWLCRCSREPMLMYFSTLRFVPARASRHPRKILRDVL